MILRFALGTCTTEGVPAHPSGRWGQQLGLATLPRGESRAAVTGW